jgi:hypothetical protein
MIESKARNSLALECVRAGLSSHSVDLADRAVAARSAARLQLPERWQDGPLLDAIDAAVADAAEALRRAAAEPA